MCGEWAGVNGVKLREAETGKQTWKESREQEIENRALIPEQKPKMGLDQRRRIIDKATGPFSSPF
jgi:hypothetical protein